MRGLYRAAEGRHLAKPSEPDVRPRIRTIKPEFFKDEKINSIAVGARYTAIGLMSAADDRGRLQCMLPALRAYVFPNGDVSEKQFERALSEVLGIGFAWRYEANSWAYLWLPNFWRHQRINRPSESDFPPHPDDPYGGLPITDALRQFTEASRQTHGRLTEDSVKAHGGLITSRAGARSVPFPSLEEETQRLCDRLAARMLANDPKAKTAPGSERWQTDMRLLVQDRSDVAEIERIIDWCQADPFWRANILSPGKLRAQFTQLLLKADSPLRVVPGGEKRERQARRMAAMDRVINGGAA